MRKLHPVLTLIALVGAHGSGFTVSDETTSADVFDEITSAEGLSCPPISTPKVSLDLSYVGLENLRYAFLTSEYLTDLTLDHNRIKTIPSNTFQDLPRLAHLSLSSNNIQHLDLADFRNLENLETLFLDGNCKLVVEETTQKNYEINRSMTEDDDDSVNNRHFRELFEYLRPVNDFQLILEPSIRTKVPENSCMFYFSSHLPKLTSLHLENNNLKSLVFPDGELTSLTHLYLSENPLTMSNGTDLRLSNFAPSLRHLYLDKCGLRELDMSSLKRVIEIRLGNNEFQSICSQYCDDSSLKLEGAVDLKILALNSNEISKIEADSFNHTLNLTILDLSHNKLSNIRQGTFDKLHRLISLNLGGNRLTKLSGNIFERLDSMRVLDLGCNQIQYLDVDDFGYLPRLEKLSLHNNLLTSIKPGTFSSLYKLKNLDLSYNRFYDVNHINFTQGYYDYLKATVLNLSGNPLNAIATRWFNKLSSDSVVYLGNGPSTCGSG